MQGSAAARPIFDELLLHCQGPGKLHAMHVRVMDSYMPLSNGCRRTGDVVGAIKHVTALINAMEFYYRFPCIEVTNLCKHLVELHLQWADSAPSAKLAARPKKQAKDVYRKYETLRSVCQRQAHDDDDLLAKLRRL